MIKNRLIRKITMRKIRNRNKKLTFILKFIMLDMPNI